MLRHSDDQRHQPPSAHLARPASPGPRSWPGQPCSDSAQSRRGKNTSVCFYRVTNENPEHHNIKLGDAVMASAAAPTYFPAHRINGETGDRYIDGGIYANAPDIAAITIAMKKWHRLTLDRIYLLSIGTTNHAASPYDSNHRGNIGVWGWAAKPMARLLHVAMRGQVDHSTGLLTQLPMAMFCRIERELESDGDVCFALDNTDAKTMAALVDAGREAVEKCLVGTNSDLRLVLARGK